MPSPALDKLLELWREVLDIDDVELDADFLALGGHSIAALRLIARIRAELEVELDLAAFLEARTIRAIAARIEESPRASSAPPRRRGGTSAPLSAGQRRLWLLHLLDRRSAAYHIPFSIELRGALDAAAFDRSTIAVLHRHPVLSSAIVERQDGPAHELREPHPPRWIDLSALPPSAAQREAERIAREELRRPFDLAEGPLIRVDVLRLAPAVHRVQVVIHHAAADRWSVEVFVRECAALYSLLAADPRAIFPEAEDQFFDHACAEAERAASGGFDAAIAELAPLLEGTPQLELAAERGSSASDRAERVELVIPPELRGRLVRVARDHQATLFTTVLAAYFVLLARRSGQEDFAIGAPVANRSSRWAERSIGFFANTIVVRGDLSGDPTFAELLERVRRRTLAVLKHQHVPYERIVHAVHPRREGTQNPLFQAMLTWNELPARPSFAGLDARIYEQAPADTAIDVGLTVNDDGRALRAAFDLRADRWDRRSRERLVAAFRALLEDIAADPGRRISALAAIGAEEVAELLARSSSKREAIAAIDPAELLVRRIEAQPDAVAIVHRGAHLTYRALGRRIGAFAQELERIGVGRGAHVAVMFDRGPDLIAAIFAVLARGAAYVALDPAFPPARLQQIAAGAIVSALICERRHRERVPAIAAITAEDVPRSGVPARPVPCSPEDLAYLMFTSGSSGRPKGVMVERRQLANFLGAIDELLGTAPGRWLAVTTASFDISVLELIWTACRGFCIVLESDAIARARRSPAVELSLFHFASSSDGGGDPYRLLLEGAKIADERGLAAVWTPERHFHRFGGPFPNPALTSAALAATTKRIRIRAGSVVLPLHHPVRFVEDWSVVDNLSRGRVDVAFASGWNPDDFVLAPAAYAARRTELFATLEQVRALWRGDALAMSDPEGRVVEVRTLPRPVQKELPVWITAARDPETFRAAGRIGANVLTHLLGQTLEEVAEKIAAYRGARREHGFDPEAGRVTLMLHTYVGESAEDVRSRVRAPLMSYLRSSFDLIRGLARSAGLDPQELASQGTEQLLAWAGDRFREASGLFGTPQSCVEMVERAREAGADEIACLIDFGLADEVVLAGLERLAELNELLRRGARAGARSLAEVIERERITHFQCTPSLARFLTAAPKDDRALRSLEVLLIGGEPFDGALARELRARTPGRLINMYGPTETTVWSTRREVVSPPPEGPLEIGAPLRNNEVYVLGPNLEMRPIGAVGELFIGGFGVARGYYGRPDLTAERFLPNPFAAAPGERLYRSGDRARFAENGALEVRGRLDEQVKLRGFRVELGEVRAAINEIAGVEDSAVFVEGEQLAALVVMKQADEEAVRRSLRARLPDYMVPAQVITVAALPLNVNGKLDRARLRELAPARSSPEPGVSWTARERLVAGLFRETLGRDVVHADENFFELGGHSLLALRLTVRLREESRLELPLTSVFEAQSVRKLAALLDTFEWLHHQQPPSREGNEEVEI